MNRIVYSILLILSLVFSANSQLELNSSFMPDLHQGNNINPAYGSKQSWVISLGSVYGNFQQGRLRIGDILFNQAARSTNPSLQLLASSDISIIDLAYNRQNVGFRLYHKYKLFNDIALSSDLSDLVFKGNAALIGRSIDVSPQLNMMLYTETGLGFRYTGTLSVGANLKLINGLAGLVTGNGSVQLTTSDDIYQLNFNSNYELNTSLPFDLFTEDSTQMAIELNQFLFPNNYGFAVDLGVDYVWESWRFSASILDLGILNWKNNPTNYRNEGNFSFDGLGIDEILEGDLDLIDSIENTFRIDESANSYQQFIPARFIISTNYSFEQDWKLGATFFYQSTLDRANIAFAINGRKMFGKKHSLGLQYGFINGNPLNIGVQFKTQLGPIQFYGMTDNIIGLFNPYSTGNGNIRVGLNLAFGSWLD